MVGRTLPLAILALLAMTSACATAVDMDSVNGRIDENAKRIAALETAQPSEVESKLRSLEKEVEDLRKSFADSNWNIQELKERMDAFKAYMDETEQFVTQFRKRGGEIDEALEDITNRLEADVRSLAEKLKMLLEDNTR